MRRRGDLRTHAEAIDASRWRPPTGGATREEILCKTKKDRKEGPRPNSFYGGKALRTQTRANTYTQTYTGGRGCLDDIGLLQDWTGWCGAGLVPATVWSSALVKPSLPCLDGETTE